MSDVKDPAIKLFGKTIQLPDTVPPATDSVGVNHSSQLSDGDLLSSKHNSDEADKDPTSDDDTTEEDGTQATIAEEPTNPTAISAIKDSTKPIDSKPALDDDQNTENAQNEASNAEEKTLMKPDKIIPCPRCNSMDTKFCYYNNYNVNQPRHFCKNCQRYWTAGGTMRNVPVGAGRRKNKYSASHYRHIGVSEALQNVGVDIQNVIDHPALKTNGTVLTFGSEAPLCESMTSVLKLTGKTLLNSSPNGFQKQGELRPPVSYGAKDNGDDPTSKSSVTSSNSKDVVVTPSLQNQGNPNCHTFPPQLPCFPGAPWPYPWNIGQWNTPITQVPPPGFCGFPMPFYPPAPYWGCNVPVPGAWNLQWVTPALSTNHTAPSSGPNSPTLGKHSRDENVPNSTSSADEGSLKENNPAEKSLWVPKTLRIDDLGEAAKNSIWETLGIKNEIADPDSGRRGMFKAFQSKGNEKDHISNSSAVLNANPAAVSRSQRFHEST